MNCNTMTKEWYLKRIYNLNVSSIQKLDSKSLAGLTCGFNILYVGKLILRGENVIHQRQMLQYINNKYTIWKRETRPKSEPAHLHELFALVSLSLDCGMIIRPEELDKFLSDAENNTITDVKKSETISALEARIKELEAENGTLKEQIAQQSVVVEKTDTMKVLRENERLRKEREEMIVELLKPIFYNSEQDVKEFLKKNKDRQDTEIIDTVCEFVKDRKISDKSKGRPLWKILHAAKYYSSTESNWNTLLRTHP